MRFRDLGIGAGDPVSRLRELRTRALNFDPATAGGPGWHRDDYRQQLPAEEPGGPEPNGSWAAATRLSRAFAFADPSLVEAWYDETIPLRQRDMLLILHVLGLRVYAGARVSGEGDETRVADGRTARVSFWSYRTLEGHPEAGQRDYEIWKWLDTGAVEFRTHSYSRPAKANAIFAVGIRLLGPHKQVEFGRRACARMAALIAAELA